MFIRTTEQRHADACQAIWRRLRDAGDIYLGHYEGWYAVRDETFYTEDELHAGPDGAAAGADRRAGRVDARAELLLPALRLAGPAARLLRGQPGLRPAGDAGATRWSSFVRGGLDRSGGQPHRRSRWGVPVPDDPAHVMYVWLDALINYITACGFPDEADPLWRFWPADIHVVGKDILRFHAVIWPAVLMAAGLAPPRRVVAHGWWTARGEKMSKSVGNAIDGVALVHEYGLDPVRFFVLREVPFGNDGDFSDAALIRRLNSELANDLGNLAQRTLTQIARNLGGALPEQRPRRRRRIARCSSAAQRACRRCCGR